MTDTVEITAEEPSAEEVNRSLGRRVTREMIIIATFYFIYSFSRNLTGSAAVSRQTAELNAERLIQAERNFRMFHEAAIQQYFLDHHWLLWITNVFYGSAHFVVTIGVLVWLFIAVPDQYRFWRNMLAFTTALALVGFVLFPLLPPRLLPPSYNFTDTLKTVGGLWNFESGALSKVSNQYAAMPSLHFGWAAWCGLVIVTLARRRWAKALGALYPLATLFSIVITGNHYVFDAVGGAFVLVIAILFSRGIELARSREERRFARAERRQAQLAQAISQPAEEAQETSHA